MNKHVKSTLIAVILVATLSRSLKPVQAHEAASAVLSKSPVVMQSHHVVNRIRPVVLRVRPVSMQRFVYLNSRVAVQLIKHSVAY